jgi:hypothetical protein
MLTAGMLSAVIASASESCFAEPSMVTVRLLSMSEGSTAQAGADEKRLAATTM